MYLCIVRTVCIKTLTLIFEPLFFTERLSITGHFFSMLLFTILLTHLEIICINQVVYCIMSKVKHFDGLSTQQHSFVSTTAIV